MRIGLNVKQAKGGMLPHTFFDVAGRRIGVYLQRDERAQHRELRAFVVEMENLRVELSRESLDRRFGDGRVAAAEPLTDKNLFEVELFRHVTLLARQSTPPRPRSPEALTSSTTCSGVIAVSALRQPA